jgi:hypothetical protein
MCEASHPCTGVEPISEEWSAGSMGRLAWVDRRASRTLDPKSLTITPSAARADWRADQARRNRRMFGWFNYMRLETRLLVAFPDLVASVGGCVGRPGYLMPTSLSNEMNWEDR